MFICCHLFGVRHHFHMISLADSIKSSKNNTGYNVSSIMLILSFNVSFNQHISNNIWHGRYCSPTLQMRTWHPEGVKHEATCPKWPSQYVSEDIRFICSHATTSHHTWFQNILGMGFVAHQEKKKTYALKIQKPKPSSDTWHRVHVERKILSCSVWRCEINRIRNTGCGECCDANREPNLSCMCAAFSATQTTFRVHSSSTIPY